MKPFTYKYKISFILANVLFILFLFTACNKNFPNILKDSGSQPDFAEGSSKVLYIIADGIRGKVLQEIELPNFRVITRNSLYSFGSLTDFENDKMTLEAGLANLITGVTNTKHKLVSGSFDQLDLNNYPSMLTRINSKSSNYSSATFTTNEALSKSLFKDADMNIIAQADEEVVTKAEEELLNGSSDLIIANLSNAYKVGLENSFEADDVAYLNELRQFDTSIGRLIDVIKKRKNYGQENWLVVITSSIGGPAMNDGVDLTSYGDDLRNTVTYFYSPKFTRSLLVRPYSLEAPFQGYAVRFANNSKIPAKASLADASDYNFGNINDDYSIQFFLKTNNSLIDDFSPAIISKRQAPFTGNGWNILLTYDFDKSVIGLGSSNTYSSYIVGTKKINDTKWHSITVTRSRKDGFVKVFMDGEFEVQDVLINTSIGNNFPLSIGKPNGSNSQKADILLCNLQIYNVALTEEEVATYSGITIIDDSHPKFDNLIGYWPGYDDVNTNMLRDVSGHNNHMQITGDYTWDSFSDIVSYFKPSIANSFYKEVPNSVDLPFFIYQWLGFVPKESWKLDGKGWTPSLLVSTE